MPDVTELALMLVFLLVIGAVAGVIAGMLGVGGGIVLVPAFFYAFTTLGYDSPQLMQICIATSLATIIVTSIRSVSAHHKKAAVDWAVLQRWAPGIGLGAVAGVFVVTGLKTAVLQGIFGGLGMAVGLYLGLGRAEWRLAAQMPGPLGRAILSPLVGFLSVLMGIGGGSFGVPLMTLCSMPIHRAVATASGFGLMIAAPSVAVLLFADIAPAGRPPFTLGAVNLVAFAVILAVSLQTTTLGVRLAHAMNPAPLRRFFGLFLTIVALNMLRKAIMA